MKKITYAGESVLTSDDIGTVLVDLTAALAKKQLAEAVTVPICDLDGADHRTAELVIGQGNDVLAVPQDTDAPEPDFSTEVTELRHQLEALSQTPRTTVTPLADNTADDFPDYELGLADFDNPTPGQSAT